MGMSKIEWCDMTINPVVGCTKCSPGCDNCYAERFAARMAKHPNPKISKKYAGVVDEHGKWTGNICDPDFWDTNFLRNFPHRVPGWNKRVFIGSMTDIFHPNFSHERLDTIFASILYDAIITNGHGHTFTILTKRADRMLDYFAAGPEAMLLRWGKAGDGWLHVGDGDEMFSEYAEGQTIPQQGHENYPNLRHEYLWPLSNVWLGVTVCNQAEADEKIPVLLQTPAAKRFVSVEPMLGPIDLQAIYPCDWMHCKVCGWYGPDDGERGADHTGNEEDGFVTICPECGNDGEAGEFDWTRECAKAYCETILPGLDWVICGGETGPKGRPMHPYWVRSLRDQCEAAGTPFFFKGWGEWTTDYTYDDAISTHGAYVDDTPFARVGKSRSGRLLDGREWNEVPS